VLKTEGRELLAIEVDRYPEPCATAGGKSLRWIIGGDGKPQSVPLYPRDQRSMRIDLGLLDLSAQPVESAAFDDLDPLEFERLRQAVVRLRGDASLKALSDQELAKALRLVETSGRGLTPNVAGLLLLGRPDVLRRLLPTHGVFFQVLDAPGNVVVDETPLGPVTKSRMQIVSAAWDAVCSSNLRGTCHGGDPSPRLRDRTP